MTDVITDPLKNAPLTVAIIGSGLTGLITATLLEREIKNNNLNAAITIFEKSRSIGRLANRYKIADSSYEIEDNSNEIENNADKTKDSAQKHWQWAFGVQSFTAKSADFQGFIAPFVDRKILQPWHAQVAKIMMVDDKPNLTLTETWGDRQPRYISTPKMTRFGRDLADNLTMTSVRFNTRVAPIAKGQQGNTALFAVNGESLGKFDWVICTTPAAQAMELLKDANFNPLSQLDYSHQHAMQACYTLMLGFAKAHLPKALLQHWNIAIIENSILAKVFIEHQKPDHDIDMLPSITIHARNDWSEAHVDDDIDSVKDKLLAAAKQILNWNDGCAPVHVDCHRWRFAATDLAKQSQKGILVDDDQQLIVSGDWCMDGNVEGCYQSARQSVEVIVKND